MAESPDDDIPTTDDSAIGQTMDRVREIVAQLEDGEVSLKQAKELRDEGKELLADVEAELARGEAEVIERK